MYRQGGIERLTSALTAASTATVPTRPGVPQVAEHDEMTAIPFSGASWAPQDVDQAVATTPPGRRRSPLILKRMLPVVAALRDGRPGPSRAGSSPARPAAPEMTDGIGSLAAFSTSIETVRSPTTWGDVGKSSSSGTPRADAGQR